MAELVLCLFPAISKLLFVSLVAVAFKGALWALNLFVLAPLSDPLRQLPGPRAGYWENHFWELMEYTSDLPPPLSHDAHEGLDSSPNQSPKTHDVWGRKYGKTWRFHGFGAVGPSSRRLPQRG